MSCRLVVIAGISDLSKIRSEVMTEKVQDFTYVILNKGIPLGIMGIPLGIMGIMV